MSIKTVCNQITCTSTFGSVGVATSRRKEDFHKKKQPMARRNKPYLGRKCIITNKQTQVDYLLFNQLNNYNSMFIFILTHREIHIHVP